MATPTKKPPAPPKLPSTQDAAAVIAQAKTDTQDGTPVEQLRSYLTDAQGSIGQALDLLDEIESEEQGEGE